VQPVRLDVPGLLLLRPGGRAERGQRQQPHAEQVSGRLGQVAAPAGGVQQAQRVGAAEGQHGRRDQPQRPAFRGRRRPGQRDQDRHDGEDQVGDRVRHRDTGRGRALPHLVQEVPGGGGPDQGEHRAGDQDAVDAEDDEVPAAGHRHRAGQRGGPGEQGQQGADRQDQQSDAGDRRGDAVAGVGVPHHPPDPGDRPGEQTEAEDLPPETAGPGAPAGGPEADPAGEGAGDELRGAEEQGPRPGGYGEFTGRDDGGDERQCDGKSHR
jgi:hypothetical protein